MKTVLWRGRKGGVGKTASRAGLERAAILGAMGCPTDAGDSRHAVGPETMGRAAGSGASGNRTAAPGASGGRTAARLRPALTCLFASLLAGALALGCAGCSSEADGATSVALVVSPVANQEQADYTLVQDELERASTSGGWVDVVVADGDPKTALEGGVQSAAAASTNAQQRAAQAQAVAQAFIAQAEGAQASAPQTDPLEALSVAASSLAQAPGTHEALVFSSLLSTTGVLDLAAHPDWVSAPTGYGASTAEMHAQLVEQLSALLPDLSGIDVVRVYGAGNTAGEQARPNATQLKDLQDLWEQVLHACGVSQVEFVTTPRSGIEASSSQAVSMVELPEMSVDFTPQASEEPETSSATEEAPAEEQPAQAEPQPVLQVVELTQASVAFVPDSASLADEQAAGAAIAQAVQVLAAHPEATATVYGCCASAPGGDPQALSQARAQAVADMICASGIDGSRLTAQGLGTGSNEYVTHVPDTDETGALVEPLAEQNRRVVVVIHGNAEA